MIQEFKNSFFSEFFSDKFSEYLGDTFAVWQIEALGIATAFILGMIFMLFLRCCAGVIIFFSLFAIFIVLAGGGLWFYMIGREWYIEKINGTDYSIFDSATYNVTN